MSKKFEKIFLFVKAYIIVELKLNCNFSNAVRETRGMVKAVSHKDASASC